MALARRCDRCRRVEDDEGNELRVTPWHIDPGYGVRAADLCPPCSEPLDAIYKIATPIGRGHARGKDVIDTLPVEHPDE